MTETRLPKRSDGIATREHILDVAERLIARRGYAGVSLGEIRAESGQGFKAAISYYFGNKQGLVNAILVRRFTSLEEKRQEAFDQADRAGRLDDLGTLIGLICRPIIDIKNNGECIYARFLLQFLLSFEPWPGIMHPLYGAKTGITREITTRIETLLPGLAKYDIGGWSTMFMFLGAVVDWENKRQIGQSTVSLDSVVDETIDMMTVALRHGTDRKMKKLC